MAAIALYIAAALAEIAGCFAVWMWWRAGASALWLLPGAWRSPPSPSCSR